MGPDFQALLGDAAWAALSESVRERFSAHADLRVYDGVMSVQASAVGRLIAQICRLVGTPLAPWTGEDVPVRVTVRPEPGDRKSVV